MPTYLDIADDVLVTLGYNHDDRNRHRESVLFNVQLVANRLRRQRLEKEMRGTGDRGSTDTMTTYVVPLSQEDYVGNGRMYFRLPSAVLDLQQNGGIGYICYTSDSGCPDGMVGVHFTLCTPSEADVLQGMEFQKPSPMMPYYFRARLNNGTTTFVDRCWLLGVSPLITEVEVGLYLALDLSDPLFDPNQEIDVPADMLYLIKRFVLDMERFALLVPQERLANNGRDFKVGEQPLQPPHMVSVNDPANLSTYDQP